ncbi:response regulator transcription factor [Paucibacter sp. Y2R2-4]|uniref:response regulator transcription factor n=1 Tax=Paucibacter sp. Y2R2-4 TaxID=2893553 RepID=UPI0021E4ED2A|nr:response regulator [Paucibacter sp. Y2R2-4]MCV2350521.1 response regulator [Paucibacter sp. Y2R2-4]
MTKKKVLIVDDNADILALLHATLDLAEVFEVHEARDGTAAVAAVATLQPEIVLMDIMMPGPIDGVEACRQIKAAGGDAAPKVVLISAKPVDQIKEGAKSCGADLFIAKPFGPVQLVESLTALYRT